MISEKIKNLALRREVQILLAFGIVTAVSYYIYLKNKSEKNIEAKAQELSS
jgi:hypothetical protein